MSTLFNEPLTEAQWAKLLQLIRQLASVPAQNGFPPQLWERLNKFLTDAGLQVNGNTLCACAIPKSLQELLRDEPFKAFLTLLYGAEQMLEECAGDLITDTSAAPDDEAANENLRVNFTAQSTFWKNTVETFEVNPENLGAIQLMGGDCSSATRIDFPNLQDIGDLDDDTDSYIVLFPQLLTLWMDELIYFHSQGDFEIAGNPSLLFVYLPHFNGFNGDPGASCQFGIYDNISLELIWLPALQSIGVGGLDFSENTSCTDIWIPDLETANFANPDCGMDFSDCALGQAVVDGLLVQLAWNPAFQAGLVDLRGGTNSAPGVLGLTAKAILTGKGATVLHN